MPIFYNHSPYRRARVLCTSALTTQLHATQNYTDLSDDASTITSEHYCVEVFIRSVLYSTGVITFTVKLIVHTPVGKLV